MNDATIITKRGKGKRKMGIGKYLKNIGENLIKIAEEMEKKETTTAPSGDDASNAVNNDISAMASENKENTASDGDTASKHPTKADVRALLAKMSAEGFKDEIAKLLKKYGEGNLSSVPKENYAALLAEAEEIGEESEKKGKEFGAGKEDGDA